MADMHQIKLEDLQGLYVEKNDQHLPSQMSESSLNLDSPSDLDPAFFEESANRKFQAGSYSDALVLKRQALSLYVERNSLDDQARCHQAIGYLSFLLRDYAAAEQAYRQAIRIKEAVKDYRSTAASWGRLAEVHQHVGDHPAALHAFDQSLAFLRRCGALKDVGIVLNNMAVSYREMGQREQAIQYHERALQIRRDFGDDEGLSASLHNIGVLHADIGAYDSARKALEEARRLREDLGDQASVASTELRIGVLHEQQGDHARAMACYERVIALSEELPAGTDNLAAALCNMGGLFIGQGDPSRAVPLLERARSLLRANVETPQLSYVEYHLGLARIAQGNMQEGLAAFSTAQRIQQRCGDIRHLSATLSAQAVVEARRGQFASAETLLQQALELQIRLEDHDSRIHTLKLLGCCKAEQGQSEAAQQCLAEAEKLSMLLRARTAETDIDIDMADEQISAAAVVGSARRSLQ